jgi:archaetidylinositol phosphate synthase
MTLDRIRPYTGRLFGPLVSASLAIGLTPNACSLLAFLAAGLAGAAFLYSGIVWGVIFVALNAVFDAIDGAIAREQDIASKKGDFLDHVLDRYADILIITGIFAGSLVSWQIGVFALTGVLMSSYLGTQAQAVGVGRYYGGILGRADRLGLIMAGGLVQLFVPQQLSGLTILGWVLVLFGILGHFTAIQRFFHVWRNME